MAVAMIGPKFYAWDRNGKPLAFGKLYTYQARTNTPKPTYQSEDQVVENTNPVILNGEGYANVYLSGSYKMVLKDDDDNEIWSSDPVSASQPDEWVNCLPCEYVSPLSFKVSGNFSEQFSDGRRVRFSSSLSQYLYATVDNSSYSGGFTVVNIFSGKDQVPTSVSDVCISIVGVESLPVTDSPLFVFSSVDDVKSNIKFRISESMLDASDLKASTIGFYGGWAAQIDSPHGGADYILTTIQRARDSKSDQSWQPDGVGDFYLDIGDGQTYVAMLDSENGINVAQFGARFDYNPDTNSGTDDTQSFNDALAYYKKMSPYGRSGWGIGTIELPRGNCLVNGVINRPSLIGLKWKGQGQNVSNIHTNVDTGGAMFEMNLLIQVSFEDITFIHVPISTDKSTWTRDLFEYNGQGGGRNLSVKNCEAVNFGRIVNHTNTINEDTTDMDHCTFNGCRVFIESENTQAVVNSYTDITWVGISDAIFYVAGQQQTRIESGNVVCDATFIRYKNISGKGTPNRGFDLNNVKFEWTTGNSDPSFQPKILEADGSFINSYVRMTSCGVTGGPTPDALSRFIKLGAGIHNVIIDGGVFEGIIEVEQSNSPTPQRLSAVKITDAIVADPATYAFTEIGSGAFPEIAFYNCRNGNSGSKNPINHTLKNKGQPQFDGPVMIGGSRTVNVTKADSVNSSFFGGTTDTVSYELFGQKYRAEKIRAIVSRTSDASNKTFSVYGDAAKTSLIGQFSPTDVSAIGVVYDIPITAANSITDEGLYCEVDNPATTVTMYFSIDIVAI